MVKFQIVSDLHQSVSEEQVFTKTNFVGDVLLLAGDITEGASELHCLKELPAYRVLGNHEYYDRHFIEGLQDYIEQHKHTPTTVLENDTVIYEGVRIIGSTLWTDFIAPVKDYPFFHAGKQDEFYLESQAFYCKKGMADFDYIKALSISAWMERYSKSVGYIKEVLRTKHNGPTIVMTHHAPSFKSSHPKWENSAIKGGFCSNLEWLIEEYRPDVWIHGHCHESFDYRIGQTRVICNPKGYYSNSNPDFNPRLIVEL